jgi:hypothetical protein
LEGGTCCGAGHYNLRIENYNTGQEDPFSRLSLLPYWISPSYHQEIQEEAFACLFGKAL